MSPRHESADTAPHGDLVITRTFNATRDMVWKAWTAPERLAQWWGPTGYEITVASLDLRPGGVFLYVLKAPSGDEMWGKFVYGDITPPAHMSFVNSFSDKDGGITRHPFSATWPLEVHNDFTLVEADGGTTLTLRGSPVRATVGELATFRENTANVKQGFQGTFAQLDAYLAATQA